MAEPGPSTSSGTDDSGTAPDRVNRSLTPWSRLVVEGAVIVVSILLAFGVDAAWDRAQDAAAEQRALSDLRAELTENLDAIHGRWLPAHVATVVATASVLLTLHGIDAELPQAPAQGEGLNTWYLDNVVVPLAEHDEIRAEVTLPASVVSALTATHTYGPSIASLDVLIQAGALASVSDPSLRSLLAALPAELADLTDEELFVRDVYYQEVRPRMAAVGSSLTLIEAMGDGSIGGALVSERLDLGEVTIQGSEELSRALARRTDLQVNVVGNLRGLERRFTEIVDRLE